METRMTEQQIPAPPTTPPPAGPPPSAPPTVEKQPPWGDPANFSPEKAWELIQTLKADKAQKGASNESLSQRLADMEKNAIPRDALAAALGFSTPPNPEVDLAETVKSLQTQFAASQLEATRLRIAADKKIPAEYFDLLTETDPEKLAAQAEKVGALVALKAAAEGTPAFVTNPGQGQGGPPTTPEAIAEAEYRQYHPLPSRK